MAVNALEVTRDMLLMKLKKKVEIRQRLHANEPKRELDQYINNYTIKMLMQTNKELSADVKPKLTLIKPNQ
jgi:hypothetical protein